MSETIIHIGYPKTGTTWFTDYFYPYIKNANTSYTDDISYSMSANSEFLNIKPNKENKEINIIIAHKFSGVENFKWDKGIYREFFLKHLHQNYHDASIIIFIRNQVDFLASAYSSYLTHGGTYTFKKLFKKGKLGDGTMFAFEFLDYYELIKKYKSKFGENKVHVFVYEDFLDNNKEFLLNYKQKLNFEIDLEKLVFKKHNETIRTGLASIIKTANLFVKKGVKPKIYFFNIPFLFSWMTKTNLIKINNYKIFGKKLNKEKVLGKELINFINEYYKTSNNKLLNELNITEITKYKYPL